MRSSARFGLLVASAVMLLGATAAAQTNGTVTLTPGFVPDPQRLAGVSGGPVQAQTVNPTCRGWIPQQPQHAINVPSGMQFLRTFVEAPSDTTLVIRAPNGQFFCNDDTYGTNPAIDAAYGPGTYLVWVGSYSQGNSGPYQVVFSELRTTVPAGSAGGTNPVIPSGPAVRGPLTVTSGVGGAIFDNHTTTATATVGQACTIGRLAVAISGRHTFFSDLVVTLRGPNGDSEQFQSHRNRNPFRRWNSSRFNGTSATGTWTLSVRDEVGQDSGFLNNFTLFLTCI